MDVLKARTSPDFKLSEIHEAGAIDNACQFVISSLWVAGDIRRDVVVHLCFSGPKSPPKTITFIGKYLKGLEPTEKSIAEAIKTALKVGLHLKLGEEKQVSAGIKISKQSVEKVVRSQKNLFYMHKKGELISNIKISNNSAFLIGDYIGVPKKTEKFLDRLGAKRISLGPKMIFAAHCPTIINNELDKQYENNN